VFAFSSFTALVVEDNDFVRQIVKKYLADMGLKTILEASNGMDGIAALKGNPDIVLCDIEMEPLNGFEFLKLLRKQPGPERDLPVLFLTSSADSDYVQRAIDLGVSAYLLKPVMPDALRKKMTEVLSRAMSA
jgi:two-component system, chemotaxis family, chemotaxis protein CheY